MQVSYLDLYLIHTPFGFKDVEGNLHPMTPEGKIDIDVTTDHVALWKVSSQLMLMDPAIKKLDKYFVKQLLYLQSAVM